MTLWGNINQKLENNVPDIYIAIAKIVYLIFWLINFWIFLCFYRFSLGKIIYTRLFEINQDMFRGQYYINSALKDSYFVDGII